VALGWICPKADPTAAVVIGESGRERSFAYYPRDVSLHLPTNRPWGIDHLLLRAHT